MRDDYFEKELEYINHFANRKYNADEVYVFTVNLCNNDVDKDYEAFSFAALLELEKLFVGKTGFLDNTPLRKNNTARIFVCGVERVQGRKTKAGENYYRLVARAFIPIAIDNTDVITRIENGSVSEISVGCSVGEKVCSICGKNIHVCEHKKGEMYEGKLCYAKIYDIADVYEWSAVAKPVVKKKATVRCLTSPESAIERLKSIRHNSLSLQKAIERAVLAIQLQYIGREPMYVNDNGIDVYTCPECWCSIPNTYQSHCDHCGQRLDWWRYRT